MRISNWRWRGSAAVVGILIAAAGLAVLTVYDGDEQKAEVGAKYETPRDAFKAGLTALADENVAGALPALGYAADRGMLGAQLRLAELYRTHETHGNDAKAAAYYNLVVNQHGDIDRLHPAARYVADAYRYLAGYYLEGVREIGLKQAPVKAAQLMRHAASYFRDPKAQFEIGRMYAEGRGVIRNRNLAASWLLKASQKRYAPAQAYLGEMLWQADASQEMRARGLAFLALAVDNAVDLERDGIEQRYRQIGEDANAEEIEQAELLVARWNGLGSRGAAYSAAAQLRALRASPLGIAPMGSLVVSTRGESALAFDRLGRSPSGALITDVGLHFPYELAQSDYGELSADNLTPPHAVQRLFVERPSPSLADGSDLFTAVKVDRYSGETLSIDAGLAAQ